MSKKSKASLEKLHDLWRKIESAERDLSWEIKQREEYRLKLHKSHSCVVQYEKTLCDLKFDATQLEALFEIKE